MENKKKFFKELTYSIYLLILNICKYHANLIRNDQEQYFFCESHYKDHIGRF